MFLILKAGIGATIRIGPEMLCLPYHCLPYAGLKKKILCRDAMSPVQEIFWQYIITPRARKTNTNDQEYKRIFYWVVIHGIKIIYIWVKLCRLRLNFIMNVLGPFSHWRGYLSFLNIQVSSLFFFFFLSTIVLKGVKKNEAA